jgi:hypothetical protein
MFRTDLSTAFVLLSLALCSCANPRKLAEPDFTKKLAIKKSFIPEFTQNEKAVEIGYFVKHPDLEIRKEFVTHLRHVDYVNYGIFLAFGVGIYGVLDDNRDLQTGGLIAIILPYLFMPIIKRNIIRIAKKHNKKIDANSTYIIPDYNIENGSTSVKVQIMF